MASIKPVSEPLRVDKWLWAARFFKSRSMARQAVDGGKVHLNGARIKPARLIQVGDRLDITRGEQRFEVVVEALSQHRGPATQAQALYSESQGSIERRAAEQEQRRLRRQDQTGPERRPDKRGRRRLRDLKR